VRYPPGFHYEDNKIELGNATLEETYHAMEALYDAGLIKSLGISNYNGALLLDLFRYAKQLPQTLQIEHHPYLTQEPLLKLCKERDIAVTAYSSFGPLSFVELDMQKAKDTPMLFDHEVVKTIADAHGKSPAQVLLRWSTQRGVAVIPKSNNQSRLAQNLDVCSFDLKQDEIEKISSLDKGLRFNNPTNVSVLRCNAEMTVLLLTLHCSTASTSPFSHRVCKAWNEIMTRFLQSQ
jgi:D-xylose reductase